MSLMVLQSLRYFAEIVVPVGMTPEVLVQQVAPELWEQLKLSVVAQSEEAVVAVRLLGLIYSDTTVPTDSWVPENQSRHTLNNHDQVKFIYHTTQLQMLGFFHKGRE